MISKLKYLFALALTFTATPVWGQVTAPGGDANQVQSQTSIGDLQTVVSEIFTILVYFIFPSVATLYLALSGYRYIIAQGNPDLVEKAKRSLLYSVYGVLLTYASAALINLFAKSLNVPGI